MTPGTGHKDPRGSVAWREVAVTWALAAALLGALVLAMPSHGNKRLPSGLWSLAPAAGGHAHPRAADANDPDSDETCSDRDYANELC